MALSNKDIVAQSKAAINQWGDQWREHAKEHSSYDKIPFNDFQNVGVGRSLLLVANGYSFEENIDTIIKNRDNVDIMACDKTLGNLLDHGIKPDYCMVCDANVSYEQYCEPYKDQLQDTVLFINVAGNPKFTKNGNWKNVVFFVNMDALESEVEFSKLSGSKNFIPAATNVSGAMLVLATQSTKQGRNNFFGYDKIILIGFDYSWQEGHYYAFNKDADGKEHYMRHLDTLNRANKQCFTSHNLRFSAQWISDYIRNFNLPVVIGSGSTLVQHAKVRPLDKEMQYSYKPGEGKQVRKMVKQLAEYRLQSAQLEGKLSSIGKDHWINFKHSI